jgi:hypothetical protein
MTTWNMICYCSVAILLGLQFAPNVAFASPLNVCEKACDAVHVTCKEAGAQPWGRPQRKIAIITYLVVISVE